VEFTDTWKHSLMEDFFTGKTLSLMAVSPCRPSPLLSQKHHPVFSPINSAESRLLRERLRSPLSSSIRQKKRVIAKRSVIVMLYVRAEVMVRARCWVFVIFANEHMMCIAMSTCAQCVALFCLSARSAPLSIYISEQF
jgi:hypothetical protein